MITAPHDDEQLVDIEARNVRWSHTVLEQREVTLRYVEFGVEVPVVTGAPEPGPNTL